jgi:hypothetical protein
LRVSQDPNVGGIYVGSIDSKPEEQSRRRLLASDRQAYYAAPVGGGPAHLIFLRGSTLMAQVFDPDKLELSGEPVAIADGIDSYAANQGGLFSVSETGALVYRKGSGSDTVLTWLDEKGNPAGAVGAPGVYNSPAVSPDGKRIAVAMGPPGSGDIWILDTVRGTTSRAPVTFTPNPPTAWAK